jgi:ABC-2 type transport system ATP-binding protein
VKVDAKNLIKRYGEHFELRIPSIRIEAGESFGLVGNNGAGKTTFLRLLLDLIAADEGCIELDGVGVTGRDDWKAHTGAYIDESFLLDFLTADEYFDFVGTTYGMSRHDVQAAVAPFQSFFTERVLGERTRYIRDLSVGNKKKVGLVAAMFVRPRLLVLDEPFANLDPGSQLRLLSLLRDLSKNNSTTMVISSHDLEYVTQVCGRVTVLEAGQILSDTETSEATLPELRRYFEMHANGG